MNRDHMTRSRWQADSQAFYQRGYRAGLAAANRMWTQTATTSTGSSSSAVYLYSRAA